MNRATWALLLAVVLFGGALLAFVLSNGKSTTTRTREHTTVLVEPSQTPLHDPGPKNNPGKKTTRRSGSSVPGQQTSPINPTHVRKSPPRSIRRQTPKTPHKPSAGQQTPNTGGQAPNPPPAQPPPVVGVTVPAPVHVCVRPVAGVNC